MTHKRYSKEKNSNATRPNQTPLNDADPTEIKEFAQEFQVIDFYYGATYDNPKHFTATEDTAVIEANGQILRVSTRESFPAVFFMNNLNKKRKFILELSAHTLTDNPKKKAGLEGEWWYYKARGRILKKLGAGLYAIDCGVTTVVLKCPNSTRKKGEFIEASGSLILRRETQLELGLIEAKEIEESKESERTTRDFIKWYIFKRDEYNKSKPVLEQFFEELREPKGISKKIKEKIMKTFSR